MEMKRFLNMVADIFYPRCCPVCQKILADQRRMICPECEKELRPIGHPRCYKCGKPIETGEYCRDCQKHRHMYEQGRGIFVYDGIMRRSVTRYKYYGCREYGDFYARAMYRYAQKELREWKPDLIVPVPVHRSKERQSGETRSLYRDFHRCQYCAESFKDKVAEKTECFAEKKKPGKSVLRDRRCQGKEYLGDR